MSVALDVCCSLDVCCPRCLLQPRGQPSSKDESCLDVCEATAPLRASQPPSLRVHASRMHAWRAQYASLQPSAAQAPPIYGSAARLLARPTRGFRPVVAVRAIPLMHTIRLPPLHTIVALWLCGRHTTDHTGHGGIRRWGCAHLGPSLVRPSHLPQGLIARTSANH